MRLRVRGCMQKFVEFACLMQRQWSTVRETFGLVFEGTDWKSTTSARNCDHDNDTNFKIHPRTLTAAIVNSDEENDLPVLDSSFVWQAQKGTIHPRTLTAAIVNSDEENDLPVLDSSFVWQAQKGTSERDSPLAVRKPGALQIKVNKTSADFNLRKAGQVKPPVFPRLSSALLSSSIFIFFSKKQHSLHSVRTSIMVRLHSATIVKLTQNFWTAQTGKNFSTKPNLQDALKFWVSCCSHCEATSDRCRHHKSTPDRRQDLRLSSNSNPYSKRQFTIVCFSANRNWNKNFWPIRQEQITLLEPPPKQNIKIPHMRPKQ